MPIARIMNNPDGSTPTPQMGGGDVNGTLARSLFFCHAGTACDKLSVPRHLTAQTTTMGIPGAVAPQNSSEPVMLASEGIPSPDLDGLAVTPDPPSGLTAPPNPLEGMVNA